METEMRSFFSVLQFPTVSGPFHNLAGSVTKGGCRLTTSAQSRRRVAVKQNHVT